MLREDNTGFVNFPMEGRVFNKLQTGKTMVYLVAFDVIDLMNTPYDLSNTKLKLPGTFISDDVFPRKRTQDFNMSIDEMIENQIKENDLIVINGAQLLLSEEFKYQIKNENDD